MWCDVRDLGSRAMPRHSDDLNFAGEAQDRHGFWQARAPRRGCHPRPGSAAQTIPAAYRRGVRRSQPFRLATGQIRAWLRRVPPPRHSVCATTAMSKRRANCAISPEPCPIMAISRTNAVAATPLSTASLAILSAKACADLRAEDRPPRPGSELAPAPDRELPRRIAGQTGHRQMSTEHFG